MDPLWVSVVVTVVLVCITAYYALETRIIARATAEQAQELRQQRISASQPVLWPMIMGWDFNNLKVIFENIGNGPALDIDIYLCRGEDLAISDCEYTWYSYMVAGEKKIHNFLRQPLGDDGQGGTMAPDSSVISKLMGKYTLLVEWHDLYKSGPFFQAKLPFSLEINSDGKLYAKECVVVINQISEKRKGQNTIG
ncbi:MAG: hypothetical protein Q8O43_00645 [Dehalococcoidia bacterium]|nr:hypothetical protein [Dehalococcoidia bacterium]